MTLRADFLVDRRRLKRSITLWRLLSVVAALMLITVIALQSDEISASIGYNPHIARIDISGIIRENRDREDLLKEISESDNVKGVILRINSPGGTTVGGESLHNALLKLAKEKPVVAVFSTVATSAAYMAGIASDHIIARGSSITGSVGVILQWAEVTEMLSKLGIKMEEVRSGPLKAVPSPFRTIDEQGREVTREMVMEAKTWFVDMVAKRRSLDPQSVPGLTDGRVYSGRQALKHKLIDQLGGEEDAVKWLEVKRQIPEDLKIIDWEVESSSGVGFFSKAARSILSQAGLPSSMLDTILGPGNVLERVQLDGLVSVWHFQGN
jgi:protease-4